MADFDFEEPSEHADVDRDLGIPDDMTQRQVLSSSVIKAYGVQQELMEQVHGMLAEYVRFAAAEAAEAAAQLLIMHPKDDRELFELQKRASAYASVMAWIKKTLREGNQASEILQQLDEFNREEEEAGEF